MAGMEASIAKRRWFWPAPAWLVWGAAAATGVLFACERWRWFFLGQHKGYAVLAAVAVVGAVLVLIPAWMLGALLFRRRVQFGLRTLLVFVTLCAVVCSWLAVRIKQARRQAEAVAMMREKLGASLWYDWQYDDRAWPLSNPLPPGPGPVRKLLGVDFFAGVGMVWLRGPEATDAGLARLGGLTRLGGLSLMGQQITDAGLSQLGGMTNLRELYLTDTQVTDEGVKKLHRVLPHCAIWVKDTRRY